MNDEYEVKNGEVKTLSNNNGGVLGGMTNGAPIVVSAVIKPTPSILKPQKTVDYVNMTEPDLCDDDLIEYCAQSRACY